ncbi:hypothetical protein GOP47_0022801 [Adiantum capillus-veneris]|uniref:Uncharacterized protein n=1 Tax=Adiantum capillus-veneris TaxID=13818 RepID=A0A9D4U765_ADICA|nr:hypothetical protein GOP47_0022801 [Adiantum capillus-veneris]
MQNAWKNPFTGNCEEARWQNSLGELSDEDDICPDQVVYHEDHLENLFGLYNRADEAKLGGRLKQNILKTERDCFQDHLALAIPSDRETAVWSALQASELGFQEVYRGPENDWEQVESYSSLNATVEEEQLVTDCLGNGSMHGLEDKIMVADGSQYTETTQAEVRTDTNISEVQLRDGWEYVNASIDHTREHVADQSSIKFKSHCFVKPKGTNKKKLNLSFRSMHNVPHTQQGDEQRNECQNLSLAQKLQSLAEPSSAKSETQASSKSLDSCTRVPMSEKLLQLVQNDARHKLKKKGKKTPDLPATMSLKLCMKEDFQEEASVAIRDTPIVSINDQFRKALLEAPPVSAEELNRQSKVQGMNPGFAARLQKVLERERNERTGFLRWLQTRHDASEGKISCMDVKIISKSLEGRLSACECNILECSEAYDKDSRNLKVMVIFNMQANSQLELECGTIVRLYPPWREVLALNGSDVVKTILCTYFCEAVSNHETR